MAKFGIDVSKWQGSNFDFARAKREDRIKFVILRGAYSTGKDTQFENYYAKCKSLNLPVGVYHYSMATTVAGAKKEAEFLYKHVLKGKQFELPIYIDVEDKVQIALPKQQLTDIVKTWCSYLEERKYFVGIYAGKYTFQSDLDDAQLKRYTHWIAMWSQQCTYEDKSVLGMWQFGGETNKIRSNKIAGQTVDQNFMYVDFPSIIKREKFNGFGNTPAKVEIVKDDFTVGDTIKLINGATYSNGKTVPLWVRLSKLYVRSKEFEGGYYNISTLKSGDITGRIHKKYFKKA